MAPQGLTWIAFEAVFWESCVILSSDYHSAKRQAAHLLNAPFESVEVVRAPALDPYELDTAFPCLVVDDHAWRMDCAGCGRSLASSKDLGSVLSSAGRHHVSTGLVFCAWQCEKRLERSETAQRLKLDQFVRQVRQAVPGIKLRGVEGLWPRITMSAYFTLPGGKRQGFVVDQLGDGNLQWTWPDKDDRSDPGTSGVGR